ncbi:MAG: small basic protein [Phycisphaerae bacterium]|nr:small basic protein [Phycisphaerae bacterium]
MSLDKSLKSQNSLVRHRNVLTRAERLEKLEEEDRWSEGASVLGLAKVAHRKAVLAKKSKEKVEEVSEAAEGAAETSEQTEQSDKPKTGEVSQ